MSGGEEEQHHRDNNNSLSLKASAHTDPAAPPLEYGFLFFVLFLCFGVSRRFLTLPR